LTNYHLLGPPAVCPSRSLNLLWFYLWTPGRWVASSFESGSWKDFFFYCGAGFETQSWSHVRGRATSPALTFAFVVVVETGSL
jgi:hypothetical protein